MNTDNESNAKDWILNIIMKLQKGNFDSERALKIEYLYGSWGMTYVFHVGIYLWPIQVLVTTIMSVIFRRRKLLGVTQKFIILIMTIDLFHIDFSRSWCPAKSVPIGLRFRGIPCLSGIDVFITFTDGISCYVGVAEHIDVFTSFHAGWLPA